MILASLLDEGDTLSFVLDNGPPTNLKVAREVPDTILRGTALGENGSSSFMLSLFTDHTLLYSAHTFVDQGIAINMLGHCQRTKT